MGSIIWKKHFKSYLVWIQAQAVQIPFCFLISSLILVGFPGSQIMWEIKCLYFFGFDALQGDIRARQIFNFQIVPDAEV